MQEEEVEEVEEEEEEEEVGTVQQSMREDTSREDTIASWVCSKFNISFTEKGVDVLPGLGNMAKKAPKKSPINPSCGGSRGEVNTLTLLPGNIYRI